MRKNASSVLYDCIRIQDISIRVQSFELYDRILERCRDDGLFLHHQTLLNIEVAISYDLIHGLPKKVFEQFKDDPKRYCVSCEIKNNVDKSVDIHCPSRLLFG